MTWNWNNFDITVIENTLTTNHIALLLEPREEYTNRKVFMVACSLADDNEFIDNDFSLFLTSKNIIKSISDIDDTALSEIQDCFESYSISTNNDKEFIDNVNALKICYSIFYILYKSAKTNSLKGIKDIDFDSEFPVVKISAWPMFNSVYSSLNKYFKCELYLIPRTGSSTATTSCDIKTLNTEIDVDDDCFCTYVKIQTNTPIFTLANTLYMFINYEDFTSYKDYIANLKATYKSKGQEVEDQLDALCEQHDVISLENYINTNIDLLRKWSYIYSHLASQALGNNPNGKTSFTYNVHKNVYEITLNQIFFSEVIWFINNIIEPYAAVSDPIEFMFA